MAIITYQSKYTVTFYSVHMLLRIIAYLLQKIKYGLNLVLVSTCTLSILNPRYTNAGVCMVCSVVTTGGSYFQYTNVVKFSCEIK